MPSLSATGVGAAFDMRSCASVGAEDGLRSIHSSSPSESRYAATTKVSLRLPTVEVTYTVPSRMTGLDCP